MDRWLASYQARGDSEAADVVRMRRLAAAEPDPWSRSLPLHFTASALVVHPDSGRLLLRWHQRMRMWLQAGGHGDPGESDPLGIALREAREETGLPDLVPWPDGAIKHAVVCHVPAGKGEPAHEHADVRYFLSTDNPGSAQPEHPDAPLRWLTVPEARELVGGNNLRHTLDRVAALLALRGQLERPRPGRSSPTPRARHYPRTVPRQLADGTQASCRPQSRGIFDPAFSVPRWRPARAGRLASDVIGTVDDQGCIDECYIQENIL